jgi:hypothetical protein
MYFGLNPFGVHFGYNRPPPQPQQNNQNGGFFAGFNNFIHNNFMNPLFAHNRPDPPTPDAAISRQPRSNSRRRRRK